MKYRFEHRRYRLPFRTPLWTGHGRWEAREGVLLRLENELGQITFGEACPIPWFGTETVDEVETACREMGTVVEEARIDALPDQLGCLRGAINQALRAWSEPTDQAPRSVAALLPAGRKALDLIESGSEAGFRTFKWKVGVASASDEMVLLDDVCARLPNGAKLRLDANGAWDRRTAEKWLDRCADYPVEYVEQPVWMESSAFQRAIGDPSQLSIAQRKMEDLLSGLAGDFPTPLALDESVVSGQDVMRWLDLGWPGYFVIKTSLMSAVDEPLAALSKADAKVVFSSALETAIGAKAALQRAFAWQGAKHALGFGVWPLFSEQRADGPYLAPFIRWEDVTRIEEEPVWNVLN